MAIEALGLSIPGKKRTRLRGSSLPGVGSSRRASLRGTAPGAFEEWEQFLDHEAMPRPVNRDIVLSRIRTRDEAGQYIQRFYHAAVSHGLAQDFGTPLRVIWADIARDYGIAHNELLIGVDLDNVLERVMRADIRSAEALHAESGGPLPPLPPGAEDGRGPLPDAQPPHPRRVMAKRALLGLGIVGAVVAAALGLSSPPPDDESLF